MNIYPNTACAQYCAWILANSNIRVTPQRKIQIQNVQTAANSGSYVTLLYYESFVAYTYRFYGSYLQFQALQPKAPSPTTQDAMTTAWLAVVSNPAQQTIYAVDAFFKQLRADGNLLLDYFFLFAQDQQANARIDLINPTLYSVTEHNAPTWTANQGYTGNGTNMYLSANYIDSVNAVNVGLNSETMGCYTRNIITAHTYWNMGAATSTVATALASNYTGIGKIAGLSSTSNINYADNNTQGLLSVQRNNSANMQLYKGATLITTANISSSALLNINDYVMALNNIGTPTGYDTNQYTCAYKGSGSINLITFNSAVNLLMTNLGAHY